MQIDAVKTVHYYYAHVCLVHGRFARDVWSSGCGSHVMLYLLVETSINCCVHARCVQWWTNSLSTGFHDVASI